MGETREQMMRRVAALSFWTGNPEVAPVSGGMTNVNFAVTDASGKYFVRLGEDIPVHGVLRFNEFAASQAAAACGLSPPLLHSGPGVMIFQWIDAKDADRRRSQRHGYDRPGRSAFENVPH